MATWHLSRPADIGGCQIACILSHKVSRLLQVEPSNKDVRALKLRYKKEAAAANAKDKAMYQRAFQKLAKLPDTEPRPAPQSHPIDGELQDHHYKPLRTPCEKGST